MHRLKLGNNKELIKNIKWTREVSKLFYEYASRLFFWCFASIPHKSYRKNYNLTCFPPVIKIKTADWKNKYLFFIFFRRVRSTQKSRLKTLMKKLCETLHPSFHDWNVFKTNIGCSFKHVQLLSPRLPVDVFFCLWICWKCWNRKSFSFEWKKNSKIKLSLVRVFYFSIDCFCWFRIIPTLVDFKNANLLRKH